MSCKVAGCEAPVQVKKRQLCKKHYHSAWRGGKLESVNIWRHTVISYLEGDLIGTCTECGPGVRVFIRNGRANCWRSARQSSTSQRHGLSRQALDDAVAAIENRCEICQVPFDDDRPYCVDHDHSCCPGSESCGKCIRGFLCRKCNVGVGMLDDDADRVEKAAQYLRRARPRKSAKYAENLQSTENLLNT
jgi:hypothetical protein